MYMYFMIFFFLVRPFLSIDAGVRLFGVDLFDIVTLAFSAIMFLAWLNSVLIRRTYLINGIDIAVLMFGLWCSIVFLIYIDRSQLSDVIKFMLPPLTFVLMRPFIDDPAKYRTMVLALVIGSTVPVLLSLYKILNGTGLEVVNYWTGIPRYLGAYLNAHNFGHAMTCFLMAGGMYYGLRKLDPGSGRLGPVVTGFLVILATITLFCLYKSVVRTAFLGLIIFTFLSLFYLNRRIFYLSMITSIVGLLVMLPVVKLIFIDVAETLEGTRSVERFASGRPVIWAHNLEVFKNLRFDEWLAGVGIGYRTHFSADDVWNSHNDFLEVMIQTGIIGFVIFFVIQLLFLRHILRMRGREKHLFLALFVAVSAMNFMSNSYITRFSVGQIYYMLMAYVGSIAERTARKPVQVAAATAIMPATSRAAGLSRVLKKGSRKSGFRGNR